jgi:hypothetical protein
MMVLRTRTRFRFKMPLKYSDLKVDDVPLKHSAGRKTNVVIKTGQIIG